MNGLLECATATVLPSELNATLSPESGGKAAGFAYLVPNPESDHGYAVTYGLPEWATAIAVLSGLNATLFAAPVGNVTGFEYLVPNPEAVHG